MISCIEKSLFLYRKKPQYRGSRDSTGRKTPGEPGHTRDTWGHTGTRITQPNLTTILHNHQPHQPTKGIGGFFNTRKGSFQYKISLYIITYHVAIIVYHCVSLSISQYIMSLGDTISRLVVVLAHLRVDSSLNLVPQRPRRN